MKRVMEHFGSKIALHSLKSLRKLLIPSLPKKMKALNINLRTNPLIILSLLSPLPPVSIAYYLLNV